jgi:hypothetical protein
MPRRASSARHRDAGDGNLLMNASGSSGTMPRQRRALVLYQLLIRTLSGYGSRLSSSNQGRHAGGTVCPLPTMPPAHTFVSAVACAQRVQAVLVGERR